MTRLVSTFLKIRKIPNIYKKPVRNVQTTHFARKILGGSSLGLAFVNCEGASKSDDYNKENLTHEQCIKQACLLSVNSASTLLTTTSSAVLDSCKDYKDSLNKILFLLEQVQIIEGENPELWDSIIEARINVNKAKAALNQINSYMENVEKVVNSTTEVAFLAGAEYLCTALCERLYSAQKEISDHISDLKKLEEEYVAMQAQIALKKNREKKSLKNSEISKITNVLQHN